MSRYGSYGLASSYRSSYLDSGTGSTSSYTSPTYSSYSSPTTALPYESKFEALTAGRGSRAGTSTKYDYLSTYTNIGSKYETKYNTSSSYAKAIDSDDLTRSYFAKYYNKSSPTTDSTTATSSSATSNGLSSSRSHRAYSVYLDEDRSSSRACSIVPDRINRSTSVLGDTGRSGTDGIRNRFSRTFSLYDDPDTRSQMSSVAKKEETNRDASSSSSSYTNGYSRYSSRIKDDSPPPSRASGRLSRAASPVVVKEREKSPPLTSSYTYRTRNRETRDTSPSSPTPSYRRSNGIDKEKSPVQRTYGGYSSSSSSGLTKDEDSSSRFGSRRYSTYTNGIDKEESPAKETTGGASGLRNIGNTCFMNSVLQCLSNTKQLTNYLLNDEHLREINTSNSSMKGSLIKAFATVIKGLWKGSGRVVDPSSLKGAVNRFAPRFSGYNQEDSQEFLRYLLEGLHEDVNRVLTKPTPINSEIDSSLSVCEQAMEAWKRYIRRDDSQLVDLFVGQLKSTLRCSECSHESVTFEPFWDLSLGIPARTGEVSLLDCLDSFTKEEVLDGDEMPTCERCKARRKCTKRYSLYRLPKILVVHLKRFSQSDRFKQKLSSTVTFPLNGLNLSNYTDSVTNTSYNCYAVSNHSGTLYSGHYTAFAKHWQTGQWHSYNDSRVSKCSSSNVITNEAYLLFFELSS